MSDPLSGVLKFTSANAAKEFAEKYSAARVAGQYVWSGTVVSDGTASSNYFVDSSGGITISGDWYNAHELEIEEPTPAAPMAVAMRDGIIDRLSKVVELVKYSPLDHEICIKCKPVVVTNDGAIWLQGHFSSSYDRGSRLPVCSQCGAALDKSLPIARVPSMIEEALGTLEATEYTQTCLKELGVLLVCWKNVVHHDPTMMRKWLRYSGNDIVDSAPYVHSLYLIRTFDLLDHLNI
jgi:hypothetical protein